MKNENIKFNQDEELNSSNIHKEEPETEEEPSILDILFDEDNTDPIVLQGGDGRKIAFEQVAVIPMKEKAYCMLRPLEEVEGVGENEGLIFYIDADCETGPRLELITDNETIDEVYAVYSELVDDMNSDDEDNSDDEGDSE